MNKKTTDNGMLAIRKAIQISFDLDCETMNKIRLKSLESGLTPQDQIRTLLNLSTNKPQRPRIGISITEEEISVLAEKYGIKPGDRLALKKCIQSEINDIK